MLLVDRAPAEIWQMLLPKKNILFPSIGELDDLIFYYRSHVYFVHEDGAVVRMNKPLNVHKMTQEDLWEILFHDKHTLDYDDQGIFSIGAILLDMGFVVSMKNRPGNPSFKIEIMNRVDPDSKTHTYTLFNVPFQFALYHALLKCHELNEASHGELEYEVKQVVRIEDAVENYT